MPRRLATSMIAPVASRTCPTEPGAPVMPSTCSVWIESITQTSGRSASSVASTASTEVSARTGTASACVAQPLGAQPHLGGRLLPGDVEDAAARRAEVAQRHPGERALADSRRAPEQDQRSRHEAAAQHPIQLGDPGEQPIDGRPLHLAQRDGAWRAGRPGAAGRPDPDPRAEAPARGRSVSTSVFHSPQPGQRPVQARATWPHPWQTKWESRRVTSLRVGTRPDAFAPPDRDVAGIMSTQQAYCFPFYLSRSGP